MRVIRKDPEYIDHQEYIKHFAVKGKREELSKDTIIQDSDGKNIFGYFSFPYGKDFKWALKNMDIRRLTTVRGYYKNRQNSRTFGSRPRDKFRRLPTCSKQRIVREEPKVAHVLEIYAGKLEKIYREWFPDTYQYHQTCAQDILPDWKMPNSVFTSGIVNETSQLYYHKDAKNFEGTYSNMIVVRKDTGGGGLVVPSLNVYVPCEDATLVIFNGQKFTHGVTEIEKTKPTGYRFSVVYYTLEKMTECKSVEEEMEMGRDERTQTEYKTKDQEYLKLKG